MMTSAGVYPTVGASGAIFGFLLAFGMLFLRRTVVLLIPPIPMPAIVFGSSTRFLNCLAEFSGLTRASHILRILAE